MSLCQISRRSVEQFRRYGPFSIFKMVAVRHLGFLKVEISTSGSGAQCASLRQILRRSVKPFQRWPIFDLQDGGRPPSWICFTRFGTTHEEYLVVFVAVQNLVVIGAVISIVCALRLKMPIHAPKIGVFVGFYPPKWGAE